MMAALYKSKKDLKAAIGRPLRYRETSMFGSEYKTDGEFVVVGPSESERKWYASGDDGRRPDREGVVMPTNTPGFP